MRAVFSFWSKPFLLDKEKRWPQEKYHLFSWVLAVQNAKALFDNVVLYTDKSGSEMLSLKLGLPWTKVYTNLDELNSLDYKWWDIGKFFTCSIQNGPFVHIDSDVYLWKHFDRSCLESDVIVQNPITQQKTEGYYCIPVLNVIERNNGFIPKELKDMKKMKTVHAVNTGIVGGKRLDIFKQCFRCSYRLITENVNASVWKQYEPDYFLAGEIMLGNMIEHWKMQRFKKINIKYLFNNATESYANDVGEKKGYTHLIGRSKWDQELLGRLELRVKRDYPEFYARCLG
jgi:hypothetical protein